MAVRGHDQVGALSDFGGDDVLRIGLHRDFDAGRLGGSGQTVLGLGHDNARDLDVVGSQHLKGDGAEMLGADERDAHWGGPVFRGIEAARRSDPGVVGGMGLEPMTSRLKVECSTN